MPIRRSRALVRVARKKKKTSWVKRNKKTVAYAVGGAAVGAGGGALGAEKGKKRKGAIGGAIGGALGGGFVGGGYYIKRVRRPRKPRPGW